MAADTIVQATNSLGTGTRGTVFVIFGGEIGAMLMDMRWCIMLLVLLVIADFRMGWGESSKRYWHARKKKDKVMMDQYRWHPSRAVRRTLNKLADYIVIMLMCGAIGMAVFEPVGIEHEWGAWAGAVIACGCELSSIFGHLFYLRGVTVERKTIGGFLQALAIALVKRKSNDIGEAVEDAFNQQNNEHKGTE